MVRALWLADVLRDAGCQVVEVDGWQTRGRELDIIHGVVVHDTVTPATWADTDVDRLLVRGRPDLPGPLSQLGLDRQGRFRLVASGRANHAGYSRPWGNSSLGIEVYCAGGMAGREEPWNSRQYEAVTVGARAILDRLGHGPHPQFDPRVAGHKEIDTRGKIDPYGIDMDQLRRHVAEEDDTMPVSAPEDVRYYQGILAATFDAPHDTAGPPYDIGAIDGIVGPRTAEAIRDWQTRRGIAVTGTLTVTTCVTLQSHANRAHATAEARQHGGVDLSGYAAKDHSHKGTVTVR